MTSTGGQDIKALRTRGIEFGRTFAALQVARKAEIRSAEMPPRRLIRMEIHARDPGLAFDLLESSSRSPGTQVQITEGAELRLDEHRIAKAADAAAVLYMTLTLAAGVPVTVVGNWLYDKLKEKQNQNGDQKNEARVKKIIIDRKEVHLEQGQITKVIEEHLRQEG